MFDSFTPDTVIVILIVAFAVFVSFPVQLLLCFKAKKLFVKLLPTAVSAVTAITFYIMAITAKTWIALIYIIIAVSFGVALLFSGVAWGAWAISKAIEKKN